MIQPIYGKSKLQSGETVSRLLDGEFALEFLIWLSFFNTCKHDTESATDEISRSEVLGFWVV